MSNTATGLDEKIAGLLCYILGPVSGFAFLLMENDNRFIRFHAMQSLIIFGVIMLTIVPLSRIPFIGLVLAIILWVLTLVLAIFLMVKAYAGEEYKLRWAGDLAGKILAGTDENTNGLLCYALGPASGLIFLLIESENKNIRFHAMQSLVTFGPIMIIIALLSQIPFFIGLILAWILWPLTFWLVIFLMMRAYQGERYKVRWAGDWAEKLTSG